MIVITLLTPICH